MLVTLFTKDSIHTSALPEEIGGMHWVETSNEVIPKRYGFIEAKDGVWELSPKIGNTLCDKSGTEIKSARLEKITEELFTLSSPQESVSLIIRAQTHADKTFQVIGFPQDRIITIGAAQDNTFVYPSTFVSGHHVSIDFKRDTFILTDLSSDIGTYINGVRVATQTPTKLAPSDIITILGLTICVGENFFSMNNPCGTLSIPGSDAMVFFEGQPKVERTIDDTQDEEQTYFYPAPRFKRNINRKAFSVDGPPAPEKKDDTPIALKIGPSMVMALAAVFSASIMFNNMLETSGNILRAMPMLVMAVSMVAGAVLWPTLSRRFQNKKSESIEAKRRATYAIYLDKIRMAIRDEMDTQKQILEENRIAVSECVDRLVTKSPHLMDRTYAHDDFLELRIGIGTEELAADIRYPDEHFTVEEDELAKVVYQLAKEPTDIKDAPLSIDLKTNPVIGIAGDVDATREFTSGLITQIATLHTYEDVKLVLLCDKTQTSEWGWAGYLSHTFDDAQISRMWATTLDEAAEIGLTLERIAQERSSSQGTKAEHTPYYVVVCASKYLSDKTELVSMLAKAQSPGFSLITLAKTPKDLPKQCTSIIEVDKQAATIRSKADASATPKPFTPDIFINTKVAYQITEHINTIKLDLAESKNALPDALGFMEMFEAGNLSQLNIVSRWKEGKGSTTLATPVGRDAQGEQSILNLHEKFHGPHGLIAGTTGSGKSEYIITWILSMCVNYSPKEAAFVLIDYKGGGLAGAFDNDRVRLPHLSGTITNLDGAAINRSLVSIKSELKRRQALFNRAREVAGGDNIDIYSYLDLFREGKMLEPCPHLFIVADEFAELKQQEPEFMDELISAARIGRSLGVHLVLATQKPSGVVNDQIWSNSKFKVCLKVADKADSNEMIKRPDAAELTQAGRFYLLVGYNEYFAGGQSAYSGTPYVAHDQYLVPKDDAITLVSATGRVLASAKPSTDTPAFKPSSELVAVLGHIAEVAAQEGLYAEQLWQDPIPAHITVDELADKYASERATQTQDPYCLNPIIGELDDPENQAQRLLTLPLSEEGNAIIYGTVGKGDSKLIATALYDCMEKLSPEQLNIYIVDFGNEALTVLSDAPHVSEVLTSQDTEKIETLIRILLREVAQRRAKMSGVAATFAEYAKTGDSVLPSIVVAITNFAAFSELLPQMENDFLFLVREGARYGMHIVIGANASGDVRFKIASTFKQSLVLPMSSESDYLSVLGSLRGVSIPSGVGRGLKKVGDEIFEFQVASIEEEEESFYEKAKQKNLLLNSKWQSALFGEAKRIPTMPEVLRANDLREIVFEENFVPVGISAQDCSHVLVDLNRTSLLLVSASQDFSITSFLTEVAKVFENRANTFVIDNLSESHLGIAGSNRGNIVDLAKWIEKGFPAQDKLMDHSVVIIPDACEAFLAHLGEGSSEEIKDAQSQVKRQILQMPQNTRFSFILGVSSANLNRIQSEAWGQKLLAQKVAIWVGDGLSNQYTIKVTTPLSELKKDVGEGSGYLIDKGKALLTKLVYSD